MRSLEMWFKYFVQHLAVEIRKHTQTLRQHYGAKGGNPGRLKLSWQFPLDIGNKIARILRYKKRLVL